MSGIRLNVSGEFDSSGKYWPDLNKGIRLHCNVPEKKIVYIPKVVYPTEYGYTTSRAPTKQ